MFGVLLLLMIALGLVEATLHLPVGESVGLVIVVAAIVWLVAREARKAR